MPRPAKRLRQRRPDIATPGRIRELLKGRSFFRDDSFDGDPEGKREVWELLRDELLSTWIREHPCTRPHAWWLLEAPEPRRCLNMPHPFTNAARTAFLGDKAKLLSFGKPRYLVSPTSAPGCPDDFACVYETERDYLARLNLLLPGE